MTTKTTSFDRVLKLELTIFYLTLFRRRFVELEVIWFCQCIGRKDEFGNLSDRCDRPIDMIVSTTCERILQLLVVKSRGVPRENRPNRLSDRVPKGRSPKRISLGECRVCFFHAGEIA